MTLGVKIRFFLLAAAALAVVGGIVTVFVLLNVGAAEAERREQAACVPIRAKVEKYVTKVQTAAAYLAAAEEKISAGADPGEQGRGKAWYDSEIATTKQYQLISEHFPCFDKETVGHARSWLDLIASRDDEDRVRWNCWYDGNVMHVRELPVPASVVRQCTWEQLWQAGAERR
ncbi:hypothetical protein ACFU8W_24325 [Streptomyces sp. NPDC057565]|uniref:hypothetical protein n=1 Tax=Streptomyces sp. NPDC057565 TaxID=3346169 RepID=UPI00367CB272